MFKPISTLFIFRLIVFRKTDNIIESKRLYLYWRDSISIPRLRPKFYFSGALVNAVFLVALCFSITMEALKRFYEPEKIHDPELILTVGALGLVVNLLGKERICLLIS